MNKWATIAGVVLIAGFCALGFVELMQSHIPYVTSISEVRAASGRSIQFMGVIVHESVKYDTKENELDFQLQDSAGERLSVRFDGVKPANFDSAPKAVVVGEYAAPDLIAEQVLTSCPSKYQGK